MSLIVRKLNGKTMGATPTPPNPKLGRRIRRLCVFCGSSSGTRPDYETAAVRFGEQLSKLKIALVYGGGRVGLMGALADAVLSTGGHAIGVMPRALVEKEIAHTGLTQLHVVKSMHERKALMADLSDAFVLLPGGFGSWEEFCEVVTWSQLGIHQKPCGVLNVAGYYDPLLSMAAHAVAEGFLRPAHSGMLVVEDNPEMLISRLAEVPVVTEVKWIGASER
jgi:uncharacterized protein (TIGR00730 family)